ncbi:MAG: hypothetical protein AAGA54_17055 [Myxococcota bacterium]
MTLSVAMSVATPALAFAPPKSGSKSAAATELYESGLERFDAGEYEAAIVELDGSLSIERSARALFAKAQSLNKLDRCKEAVPVYNEALGLLPEGSEAWSLVKDGLVKCIEKLGDEEAAAAAAAPVVVDEPIDEPAETETETDDPPPPAKPGKAWYKDPYAPIFIGVGAVGVGIGGYFLSEASRENAEQPERYDEFEAKGQRVQDLQVRGGIILGIGGALVLTGVIRYAVLASRNRRAKVAFTPAVAPKWAGVSVQGRF